MKELDVENPMPTLDDINQPKNFIPGHFDSKDNNFLETRSKHHNSPGVTKKLWEK